MKKLIRGLIVGLLCLGVIIFIPASLSAAWEETIPGILKLKEVSVPGTPSAGYLRLYSNDGRLRYKNDSGVDVTPIRTVTLVIAANDSPSKCKTQADYICDGTADDVQIQAAINALPATGGEIVLHGLTFNATSRITMKSNVVLTGIQAKIVSTADYAFYGKDISDIEIRGLEIDHSGGTTGTSSAILIEAVDAICRNIKIHDNEIYDSLRAGIHINIRLLDAGEGATYGFNGVFIERNYIHDFDQGSVGPDGNGIQVGRGYMENVRILNNTIEDMLSVGIFVGADVDYGTFTDVKVKNNHIKNAPRYGIDLSGLSDSEISDNYIYNADAKIDLQTKGIFIETAAIKPSSDVKIERNTVDGAGLLAIDIQNDVDYCDINYNVTRRVKNPEAGGACHIGALGDNHKVIGNRLYGDGDGSPTKGLVIGDYALISDNYLEDLTDHAISLEYSGSIIENNTIIAPVHNGIGASAGGNNLIKGNYIKDAPASYAGIKEWGTADNNLITANNLLDCAAGRKIVKGGANTVVRNNIGYVTEKSGTATLVNGNTSIAVTHGLAVTPAAGDVMVTPIEGWGNAVAFYIDTYTSTQFTIHVDADPGQDVDFAWKAIVL